MKIRLEYVFFHVFLLVMDHSRALKAPKKSQMYWDRGWDREWDGGVYRNFNA